MDAENNKQPCQCELCQPNWFLGRDGEEFVPQPQAERQEAALEELHLRKLQRAQMVTLTC